MQSKGRGAGASLLPQPKVNAADHLPLLVEIFERRFHAPVEQHPAIDFDELFAAKVFRLADGRRGCGMIAALHFVADRVVHTHLAQREAGFFETVIADGVSAEIAVGHCAFGFWLWVLGLETRAGFCTTRLRGKNNFLFRHDQFANTSPANILTQKERRRLTSVETGLAPSRK